MKNKPIRFFLYCLLLILIGVIRCLPRFFALATARFGGWVAYHVVWRQRKKVDKNLARAFGHKSEKQRRRIGCRVFQNLAQTLIDLILFSRLNASNLDKWLEGKEVFGLLRALLKKGKGVVLITAHLGNWELVGVSLSMKKFPGAALARRIYYGLYDRLLVGMRSRFGSRTIYRDSSPREMLRVLHDNGILGIVPDQDVDSVEGVFVDFFGYPAHTPTAPAKIAMLTGAPILPVAIIREGNRYRFIAGEPIECVSEGDKDELARIYTQKWSKTIEDFIRRYPEQWVWMHDRWKSAPQK